MKIQKKILLMLIFSAFIFAGNKKVEAKDFTGTIVYNITYGDDVDTQTAAMMPKTMKIIVKGKKTSMEINMGMGTSITVFDTEKNEGFTLMDMMGQKLAMKMSSEDIDKKNADVPDVDTEITGETKEIAGYNCKKAIIKPKDGSEMITVYFTDELGAGTINMNNPIFKNIDGIMLEFSVNEGGMKMTYTAVKVEKKKVSDKEFEMPEGYKVMTMEEFSNMYGG